MSDFLQTVDELGFWRGTIRQEAVNDFNRHCVVEDPLPADTLGPFEKWRRQAGAWTKCEDLRGHSWYDPDNTDNVHTAAAFDDAPPAGWAYWAPGESPVRTEAEVTRKQWDRVRARRTKLLAESDWVVVRAADRGEPVPAEWQAYRQGLRDITLQPDPFAIVWPAPPA